MYYRDLRGGLLVAALAASESVSSVELSLRLIETKSRIPIAIATPIDTNIGRLNRK